MAIASTVFGFPVSAQPKKRNSLEVLGSDEFATATPTIPKVVEITTLENNMASIAADWPVNGWYRGVDADTEAVTNLLVFTNETNNTTFDVTQHVKKQQRDQSEAGTVNSFKSAHRKSFFLWQFIDGMRLNQRKNCTMSTTKKRLYIDT